jgi:hypothetical protein
MLQNSREALNPQCPTLLAPITSLGDLDVLDGFSDMQPFPPPTPISLSNALVMSFLTTPMVSMNSSTPFPPPSHPIPSHK